MLSADFANISPFFRSLFSRADTVNGMNEALTPGLFKPTLSANQKRESRGIRASLLSSAEASHQNAAAQPTPIKVTRIHQPKTAIYPELRFVPAMIDMPIE